MDSQQVLSAAPKLGMFSIPKGAHEIIAFVGGLTLFVRGLDGPIILVSLCKELSNVRIE